MLANRGLDWCQAPDAVGADASKLGTGSGARHPMRWGRMLANRGLDWCQAPDAVGADASKLLPTRCQAPVAVPESECWQISSTYRVPGTCCDQPGC